MPIKTINKLRFNVGLYLLTRKLIEILIVAASCFARISTSMPLNNYKTYPLSCCGIQVQIENHRNLTITCKDNINLIV